MTALLLAGVAALVVGTSLPLLRPAVGLAIPAQLAGAVLLAAGCAWLLAADATMGAGFAGTIGPRFGLDPLSAFFALLVAVTAVPALLAARDSLRGAPAARPLIALTGAFLLALVGLLAARDVTTFLGLWEVMTLLPAAAILVARRDAAVRHTVFVYLAVTHIGGAGVWVAVLLLAWHGGLDGVLAAGAPQALIAAMALLGFGTKAGLAPLHAWLPRAHPVAPAHLSALMSAVMLKVALYGLVRVLFDWLEQPARWVGLALMALGLLSAIGGVLYALLERELKRLLAFSSIENVGIVALGLGAALLLDGRWAALAFGAALLHAANHTAFKALLFLGAGALSDAAGKLDLDRLGGLLRRMPWTGGAFLLGCAAIAGLPPLNGFVSEWLTLQALLALAASPAAGLSLTGALAAAGLAVSAGLALMCFAKVAGLVLLGAPRTSEAATATDAPAGTRAALALLATACVGLAVAAGPLLQVLARLAPGARDVGGGGLVLHPPGTGAFAPLGMLVAVAGLTALLTLARRTARHPAPVAPAWACGQNPSHPALAWTSAGFTKTLRLVLEPGLRTERELATESRGAVTTGISYRAEVPHLFDTLLYRPARGWALRGASAARRLQSGSLRLYLGYLLALLIVLLALVRLGLLG
jgi:formate hydrogenlyase subunit 3/multisubunit Na+/H+ antiporter MnhD subunit